MGNQLDVLRYWASKLPWVKPIIDPKGNVHMVRKCVYRLKGRRSSWFPSSIASKSMLRHGNARKLNLCGWLVLHVYKIATCQE
jgi:hypothetical protein